MGFTSCISTKVNTVDFRGTCGLTDAEIEAAAAHIRRLLLAAGRVTERDIVWVFYPGNLVFLLERGGRTLKDLQIERTGRTTVTVRAPQPAAPQPGEVLFITDGTCDYLTTVIPPQLGRSLALCATHPVSGFPLVWTFCWTGTHYALFTYRQEMSREGKFLLERSVNQALA
jgi:hypothetical protein